MRPGADLRERPTGAWETAPVEVGRHARPWPWIVVALLLLTVAALLLWPLRRPVTRSPTPQGLASPFDVHLQVDRVVATGNDRLFGARTVRPDPAAVDATARTVTDVLDDYLERMFVAPDTRFTAQPLPALLTDGALRAASEEELAGLGVVDTIARVEGRPVTVAASVFGDDADIALVVVRYTLDAPAVTTEGRTGSLRQRAAMVFVPQADGWRVTAVDAVLDVAPGVGGDVR